MKKISIILLLFATLILPQSVLALGQMTQPINIENAMRGQQIHQEIIAVNNEKVQIGVIFSASGQIKDWVKFYSPKDLKNALATTTIPASSSLNVIAVFTIPNNIPNGEYKGLVSVANLPDAYKPKGETSSSVIQKIDRQVTIKITDQENIKLTVSVIPKTYDIAVNQPLEVRIIYDNQSNVSLTPSINFKIKKDDKTVYNVIYPYPDGEPVVNPSAMYEIPALSIPTAGLSGGDYLAQLEFLRGDKSITQEQFSFSIGTSGGVFFTKIINFFKDNFTWLLGLLALLIIAIAIRKLKMNMDNDKDLAKKFKLMKKMTFKRFRNVWSGIISLF